MLYNDPIPQTDQQIKGLRIHLDVSALFIKENILFWVDLIDYACYFLSCLGFVAMQCYISDVSFIVLVISQIKHFYLSTEMTTQYAHQMKKTQEKD